MQGIAEKYLAEACIDNKCTDGGNIIIMNPQTGDILAMAGYPNYNLNQPYQANTEELKASWEMLAQGKKQRHCNKCGEIKQYQIHMNQDLHLNL